MSYESALADLKQEFGKKKLLTARDIAPWIGRSAQAQANLRHRKRLPIPQKNLGGQLVVSIYDVARYLGGAGDESGTAARSPAPPSEPAARAKRTTTSTDKPYRRPPSLGKTLRTFQKSLDTLAMQLRFEQELFQRLEAIELEPPKRP